MVGARSAFGLTLTEASVFGIGMQPYFWRIKRILWLCWKI